MTLDELYERWKEYVLIAHRSTPWSSLSLLEHYYKCEKTFVGRKKIPALKFYFRHPEVMPHGEGWAILRCDTQENCYYFTFRTNNITTHYWKKICIFFRIEAK